MEPPPLALARLRATFASGVTRPLAWRAAQLKAADQMLRDHRDAFVAAASADLGRPTFETVNVEVAPMHGDIAAILAELPALVAEQTLPTR